MYFDYDLIIPKIFGLLIMGIWLYSSARKIWKYRYSNVVRGKVVEITENTDSDSELNMMMTIEFIYNDQVVIIKHLYMGSENDYTNQVNVYVNKKSPDKSVVKPPSNMLIVYDLLIPVFFIILILISFFNVKGC